VDFFQLKRKENNKGKSKAGEINCCGRADLKFVAEG